MDPIEQSALDQSLSPSARLALLHRQDQETVEAPNAFVPLIVGDYPIAMPKKVTEQQPSLKKDGKLDLSSEDAFPVLSSPSPRTPVVSNWSSAASRAQVPSPNSQRQATSPVQSQDTLELNPNQLVANQPSKPLGYRGTAEIISEVEKRTGVKIMASTNRTGVLKILIRGAKPDIQRAKDELRARLVVKRTVKIQVPTMMRQFIVGRKGKVLEKIESISKTSITIPRKEDEEKDLVDVEIIGHDEGIAQAKEEIAKIVTANAVKETIHSDRFDPSYLLLLRNQVALLEQEFSVRVRTPAIGDTDLNVSIYGEKDKAAAALEKLEQHYEVVQGTTRKATIGIDKFKHKYLAGRDGEVLQRMLKETHCVFELPSSDMSENVTICGPENCLLEGMGFVMKRAQCVFIKELDVAGMYGATDEAQVRAQAMLTYGQQKGELKKIEAEHGVVVDRHLLKLKFVSEDEQSAVAARNAGEARDAGEALYRRLQQMKFKNAELDRHIFSHIAKHDAAKLQQLKSTNSVAILTSKDDDDHTPVLIVFEGDAEEEGDVTLDKVAEKLNDMAAKLDFVSRKVAIESKELETIRGPNDTTLNAIIGSANVQVHFNLDNSVTLRGQSADVQTVESTLRKVDEMVKNGSFVHSYKTEFAIPAAYSAHVIGKSGSQINKLKTDFGVRIDIEDPSKRDSSGFETTKGKKNYNQNQQVQVGIQGIQLNVEAAQEWITTFVTELADQVTLSLEVPKEFLGSLIGPGGRYVKRLEDKYNVIVKFPKSKSEPAQEPRTKAGRKKSDSPSKDDAITIHGRKKDASAAREELEELYKDEKEEQKNREAEKIKREAERKKYEAAKKEREDQRKERDAKKEERREELAKRKEEQSKRMEQRKERQQRQATKTNTNTSNTSNTSNTNGVNA